MALDDALKDLASFAPRQAEVVHLSKADPGLVIDFNRGGMAIGIEITAPGQLTLATLNKILRELGQPPVESIDLAPLHAA